MSRMIITFDRPETTTTFDMEWVSVDAGTPGKAAAVAMDCDSRAGHYADRAVYTETVLGRDGHYYRGYRRSRATSPGAEVWVRRPSRKS